MAWMRRVWERVQRLLWRERFAKELDREFRFHLEEQIAENKAAGMGEEEARHAAMKLFGNGTAVKEEAWEMWGWVWLEQMGQDVRYALRQLRKTPGFTATAVLTLALGIGANAAIFTLVNAVMMKNLPVADPKMLVRIGDTSDCCVNSGATEDYSLFSTDIYERLRKAAPEFEELAAMQAGFEFRPLTARRDRSQESAQSVTGEFVSGNYFRTFGLQSGAGRLLTDEDDVKGAPLVGAMSYETWKNRYAEDASIIGSTFWFNTKAVTIVGIAPAGFYGDRLSSMPPEFYFPLEATPVLMTAPYVHEPQTDWLYMIGRVKPGVESGALQAKVQGLVKRWLGETSTFKSESDAKLLETARVVLTPGGAGIQGLREQYESNLWMLLWASGLVLLIACANIANLLLVRGMRRKVEMSVRTALGAARGRIVRQLLTESVVLAGLGGIAGLAVAYAGTRMLLGLAFPGAQRMPIEANPSLTVLGFACGLSLLTGVLFGVAPAWMAARAEPADVLRSGSRGTTLGTSLLQRGLVVLQAAVSVLLLVGAGLFTQSFRKLENTDLKLEAKNRYIVHINPQAAGYGPRQLEALYRMLEQRFHDLAGVKNVGISTYTPMEDNNSSTAVQVQGQPYTNENASFVKANAEYSDAVGTKVVMGRGFDAGDESGTRAVALVNESFVKGFIPAGRNPIGERFGEPGPKSSGEFEIVGVVNDTAYTSARWLNHRMFFLPILQRRPGDPRPIEDDIGLYAGALVVETQGPVENMEELARNTLAAINPNLALVKFETFEEQIADRFSDERMLARLTVLFGGLALLLATIGLYGVTAYTVARRTSEIGIRMALGARPGTVTAMVMRGALSQTLLGLAIGVPTALGCARFVEAQLFEVKGVDGRVMMTAVLTLALASALAGLIPARRAAGTDPAQTLRTE